MVFLIFFKGVFDSFLNLSFFVYAKKTEITHIDIAESGKKLFFLYLFSSRWGINQASKT